MNLIEKAKIVAETCHHGQKYDGTLPYYNCHIVGVYETLLEYTIADEELLAAALLHDSVEDTNVTLNLIAELFTPRVAELVYAVTDERGMDRKEKHIKTYPKISSISGAIKIKLADRLFNVSYSKAHKSSMYGKYKKEYELFRGVLYCSKCEPLVQLMWNRLDKLMQYKSNSIED